MSLVPAWSAGRGPKVGASSTEDRAVRISFSLGLAVICLGLAGCSLFNKKSDTQGAGSRPFLGSGTGSSGGAAAAAPAAATGDPSAPLPGANGLLAGYVLDYNNRRLQKVFIQVVDLQETKAAPKARLEVEAQQDGSFVVQGLQPGRHYRLIARAKDGDKVLSGATITTPPNPRLSIYLSEDLTTPDTPAVPGAPTVPGRTQSGADGGAGLEPPVKTKPGDGGPSSSISPGAVGNPAPPNPANIASDVTIKDGWQRVPPPPKVNIPNPAPSLPPAPASPGAGGAGAPRDDPTLTAPALPAAEGPGVRLPSVPTPVPSCVVVGRKVDNFALYDLNGQPWEFRRHRVGKLVLLDFWFSTCHACLQSMPHVVELQRRYQQYGLEVVGIADEQGTQQEQVMKVRRVRARYGINYTTLLSSGPHCQVKWQLGVKAFPTLILLDDKGQILWNSDGHYPDEDVLRELEVEIRRGLGIR
jgi:thiol-disulfide isomerase/thioredoxin